MGLRLGSVLTLARDQQLANPERRSRSCPGVIQSDSKTDLKSFCRLQRQTPFVCPGERLRAFTAMLKHDISTLENTRLVCIGQTN